MFIKSTVHNRQISIENAAFPEVMQVQTTPIQALNTDEVMKRDLMFLTDEIHRIACIPCENDSDDDFSGVHHDKVLHEN